MNPSVGFNRSPNLFCRQARTRLEKTTFTDELL